MGSKNEDFDYEASERIELTQRKIRPKIAPNSLKTLNTLVKKGRSCGKTTTPYSREDIPSNPDIVAEQQPEKPLSKKRPERQLFQVKRGSYNDRVQNSASKRQNQALGENNSQNSKFEAKPDLEIRYARNNASRKNDPKCCSSNGSLDSNVAELKNSQKTFSELHSVYLNNNTKNLSYNNDHKKWDSRESVDSEVAVLPNNHDNFSSSHSVHSNGKTVKVNENTEYSFTITKKVSNVESITVKINDVEHPSTVTKEISNYNDNSIADAPEFSSGFSSPSQNGDVNCANYLMQSLSDSKKVHNDSSVNEVPEIVSDFSACDYAPFSVSSTDNCDLNFIPPPIPAPTIAEPNSASIVKNLTLNKDQSQLLEDNLFEKQAKRLDLQVCEVSSTVPNEEALGNKATDFSDKDQGPDVHSTLSSDDDQVVDSEHVKEIDNFLEDLEFRRSMPKTVAEKILKDLKGFLRYYFNGNSVKLYGSYWYDAAITTSNINFALITDAPVKNSFLLHMQKTLAKEMKDYKVSPFEEEIKPTRSKICFIDNEHKISCELMFLGSTVTQYLNLSNMLKAVCDKNPIIKKLVIAIKLWAEACEINETENGKLHSVGFIMLVLHYLQQLDKPLLPLLDVSSKFWGLSKSPATNDSSIGELWLGLLKYYGYKFNWNEHVVTVTDKTPVTKASKLWDVSWIAIEDPFSKKNIGESVVASDTAEFITSCFKKAYEYFITSPYDSDSNSSGSDDGSHNVRRESTFKMADCISRPPPIFCSDDDSDSENCYIPQRSAVTETFKFSKVTDAALKCVDQVLHEACDGYMLPNNHVKGREAFVDDLEKYIMKMYPGAKLKLFGSTVNGFAFKRSDLDICMTFNGHYKNNTSAGSILKKLVYHLRRNNDLKNVFALYSAQIPIIKFNFAPQNWHCDLSFSNVLAVHNSKLLCKYAMMDERCRILGGALKLLTKKTCIADCSSKTLSSYSYILMVIHFLQQVTPPVLPVMPIHDKEVFEKEIDEKELERKGVLRNRNYWFYEDVDQLKKRYLGVEKNTSTVGELWLEMLEYYLKFDYERAVSITEKDPVPSESLQRYARLINIEDPFLSKRNLGCIVSEGKAEETKKIFYRARMLFGNECSRENMKNLQEHYFSPSNLTGRIMKDIECFACGGFGHEVQDCLKADPFKYCKPWNPNRKKIKKVHNSNIRKT